MPRHSLNSFFTEEKRCFDSDFYFYFYYALTASCCFDSTSTSCQGAIDYNEFVAWTQGGKKTLAGKYKKANALVPDLQASHLRLGYFRAHFLTLWCVG